MTRRRSTLSCERKDSRDEPKRGTTQLQPRSAVFASATTQRQHGAPRVASAIWSNDSELSSRADGIHTQWDVPATKPSSTTLNTMDVPAQVRARPRRAACPDACLVAERRPLRRGLSDSQSVAENRSPRPKLRRLSGRQSVRRGALLARRLPRPRRESIGRGVIAFAQLPWSFSLRA